MQEQNSLKQSLQQKVKQNKPKQETKKKQSTFLIILAIFLMLIFTGLVSYIAYNYGKEAGEKESKKDETANEESDDNINEENNNSETIVSNELPEIDKTLQEIIDEYCIKTEILYNGQTSGWNYLIKESYLPFTINSDLMEILDNDDETQYQATCTTESEETNTDDYLENGGSILFNYTLNNNQAYSATVYDENSIELGHGGPPSLGEYGELIESGDDYKIFAYIICDDTCGGTPNSYTFHIRAQKILEFKNNYKIFINSSILISRGEDGTKLYTYLLNHLDNSEPINHVNEKEANNRMIEEFFSDLDNLENPEKEAYDTAKQFIEAIDY